MWPFSRNKVKRCSCPTLAVKGLGYEPALQARHKLRVTTHCSTCDKEVTTTERYLPIWEMPGEVGAAGVHKDCVLTFYTYEGKPCPDRLDRLYPKTKYNGAVQFAVVGHELPWQPDSYVADAPKPAPVKPKLTLVPMPPPEPPKPEVQPDSPEPNDAATRFSLLDLT